MALEEPTGEAGAGAESGAGGAEGWAPDAPEPVAPPSAPEPVAAPPEMGPTDASGEPEVGETAGEAARPPARTRSRAYEAELDRIEAGVAAEMRRRGTATGGTPAIDTAAAEAPKPAKPKQTGKRSPVRTILRLVGILLFAALGALLLGSGVYAAARGDWMDVIYVVVAVVLFGGIYLEDRRRKRAKARAEAGGEGAETSGSVVDEVLRPIGGDETAADEADAGQAGQPVTKTRRAGRLALGCLSVIILVVGGVVFEMYNDPGKDKADEYNQLSARVATLRDETEALQGELNGLFANDVLGPLIAWEAGEVRLGDPDPQQVAALQPVLQKARALVARKNADLASLTVLWDKMARLDTGKANNTYCRQQKEIDALDGELGAVTDAYFAKLQGACTGAPLGRADKKRMQREIADLLAQMDTLRARYDELVRVSWEFYNENF